MPNVVEIGARRAPAGTPQLPSEIAASAGARLTRTFHETLASCDDILFGHAQRAINGLRQAQYFDDQRQLRISRESATCAFASVCMAVLEGRATEDGPVTTVRLVDDPLQLVADDDLELDLALFRVGKRCDEMAPRLRHQVQRRLEIVFGLSSGATTPLSGAMLAKMCRAGLAPIELGLESRLIVLKQLEKRLAADMEPLLESVNSLLLEHGVLPNLRASSALPRTMPSSVSSGHAVAAARHVVAAAPAPAPDVQQLGEVLTRMTQWMAQQTAVAEVPTQAAAPVPMAAPSASAWPAAAAIAAPETQVQAELERERRRNEIAERRAAEVERAQELRFTAQRSADQVVTMVLSQAHVPDGIGQVVRGPLRRHLETVHARRGETSTEWRSACKLVRDIAWALDPETASNEQAHWCAMVPGIVSSLRAALLGVGMADHETDRVIAEFGARYEQLLAPTAAPAVAESPIAATAERTLPSFTDALRHVRQLVLGRWFELVDDQGRPQRAKLVWTSAMTERCLFVNGHGKLVADRPHARVANDLLAGQFREIDDAALATA